MVSAALTAIVFILLAGSVVGLYSGMFSMQESVRTAGAAQQYADIEGNTLTLLPYEDLPSAAHGKKNIEGANGWQSEVTLGPEKTIKDAKQRIGTVKIYKAGEGAPRASLQVPLSSKGGGGGGVPVGGIIAWPLAADPKDEGKWLECNGQMVDAAKYPKLAALMATVPDYRGVFLRGFGAQTSTHYGTVVHESGALGVLQGDAIRNILGSLIQNGVEGWPILEGAFYKAGEAYQNGYGHNQGPVPKIVFDAGRVVPVADENRPANIAVRYMIRAA